MAANVGDMVARIATAATEQSSAAAEIQNSTERIPGMARDSTAAADASSQACVQLSGLALRLQEIVGKFKVKSDRSNTEESAFCKTSGQRPSFDHWRDAFSVAHSADSAANLVSQMQRNEQAG